MVEKLNKNRGLIIADQYSLAVDPALTIMSGNFVDVEFDVFPLNAKYAKIFNALVVRNCWKKHS